MNGEGEVSAPRFARTRGGKMVHRASCRHAVDGWPWFWPETVSDAALIVWLDRTGYQVCKHCLPRGVA